MNIHDDFPSLFAYTRWADEAMLARVRTLSPDDYTREPAPGWASIRSTLVHTFDATDIWSRRLTDQPVTGRRTEADVPTIDDAERLMHQGYAAYDQLVLTLTPERLASIWSYRNFAGQTCRLPLWSVYRHVVNHATYHRGQVASKLKRFGVEPASVDFVVWAISVTPQNG